jgi:F-type H+-transporting ATPase subunit c
VKNKIVLYLVGAVGLLLVSAPAFAQGAEQTAAAGDSNVKWIAITSGFAMAIAAAACGLAQGRTASAACEALARNPGARPGIQLAMLLGLVFIETLALFTFAMIFAKVTLK